MHGKQNKFILKDTYEMKTPVIKEFMILWLSEKRNKYEISDFGSKLHLVVWSPLHPPADQHTLPKPGVSYLIADKWAKVRFISAPQFMQ